MKIHQNFVGGNIRVKEISGDTVILENELRDTEGDWFYWAFCAEDAENQEITFRFENKRLGYWGPAVSHDLKNWHWLDRVDGESFTYRFGSDEHRVYFAHNMLYHPDRFIAFAESRGLEISELCRSRKGRSVPCLHIGEGERNIIITARHHACESTGTYVMEGVLEELTSSPIPNTRILVVPFVDYDGVVDGDQGKSRALHDHNRDYTDAPIYPEVAAILDYADKYGCNFGFDLHSPYHKGGNNDRIFIVRNKVEKLDKFDRFSTLLESEITPSSMQYQKENDHPPLTGWNQPSPNFAFTMNSRPECDLAFTLESAYFGTKENKVSAERLISLGKCLAKVIRKYIGE